jgi:hypothetical protein
MNAETRAAVARALIQDQRADIAGRIRDVAQQAGVAYAAVALTFWQLVDEGILDRYGRRYGALDGEATA